MVESFWMIPDVANLRTPLGILREQASALTEQTNGTLVGVVETDIRGGWMTQSLEISVPSLSDYRFRILTYEHSIHLYPGTMVSQSEAGIRIENEAGFVEALKVILTSDRIKSVLSSLLAQANGA
jgi:hypothetical protein